MRTTLAIFMNGIVLMVLAWAIVDLRIKVRELEREKPTEQAKQFPYPFYNVKFTNVSQMSIIHGLNTWHPITMCYDDMNIAIMPDTILVNQPNEVSVTFTHAQSGHCSVVADR